MAKTGRRAYDQFCGLARALDLVGERWTLLIVRDLALGPQRYSDLLAGLPGIGTGLLAERLKQLEADGIVQRTRLPAPANVPVYELTDDGRDLAEALLPLMLWGIRRLDRQPGDLWRADWLLFSLRARFDAAAARGVREVYEFRVEGQVVHVRVDDGSIEVLRGPAPWRPDLLVETDVETFFGLASGRLSVKNVGKLKKLKVGGSDEALEHCLAILAAGAA